MSNYPYQGDYEYFDDEESEEHKFEENYNTFYNTNSTGNKLPVSKTAWEHWVQTQFKTYGIECTEEMIKNNIFNLTFEQKTFALTTYRQLLSLNPKDKND